MFNRVAQMMQENREAIFNNLSRPQGADIDVAGIIGAMPMFRNAANRQSRGMIGGMAEQVQQGMGSLLGNASAQGTGNVADPARAAIEAIFASGAGSPFGGGGSSSSGIGLKGRTISNAVQNSVSGGLFGNVAQRGGPGSLLGSMGSTVRQAVQGQTSGAGGLFGNLAQRGGPGGLLGNMASAVSQAVRSSIGQR